jgi:hypothetical protein
LARRWWARMDMFLTERSKRLSRNTWQLIMPNTKQQWRRQAPLIILLYTAVLETRETKNQPPSSTAWTIPIGKNSLKRTCLALSSGGYPLNSFGDTRSMAWSERSLMSRKFARI